MGVMGTSPAVLAIHSLTEAQLVVWAKRCGRCGNGPLAPETGAIEPSAAGPILALPVTCRSCGEVTVLRFAGIDPKAGDPRLARFVTLEESPVPPAPPVNPTGEPSRAIDVAGWLTLEAMLGEKARQLRAWASGTADRGAAREWELLAGTCVEEALKFYDPDNDLPPEEAFFDEFARRQLRDRPESFTRERLIHLRTQRPIETQARKREDP